MQTTYVVLRSIEEENLIADALLDENASGMLIHNRLFILQKGVSQVAKDQR